MDELFDARLMVQDHMADRRQRRHHPQREQHPEQNRGLLDRPAFGTRRVNPLCASIRQYRQAIRIFFRRQIGAAAIRTFRHPLKEFQPRYAGNRLQAIAILKPRWVQSLKFAFLRLLLLNFRICVHLCLPRLRDG